MVASNRKKIEELIAIEGSRLFSFPTVPETPPALGTVRFVITCNDNAASVFERAKEIFMIINQHSLTSPSEQEWRILLPQWFVENCAAEMTEDEMQAWLTKWRQLSPEKQAMVERKKSWSLSNWLYWLELPNRQWFWWDAIVIDSRTIMLAIVVREWPFPWGPLSWLFRAAGAEDVIPEE